MTHPLSRPAATLVGFSAVSLWSLLAFLTAASGTMPAFQLTAITFGIGGLAGVALWLVRPQAIKALKQPLPVWLLGVVGLFGYHFCYFFALRNAPPVEAGLINYLWPVLIVVFSALLPGESKILKEVAMGTPEGLILHRTKLLEALHKETDAEQARRLLDGHVGDADLQILTRAITRGRAIPPRAP